MSEHDAPTYADQEGPPPAEPVRTGNAAVDDVLDSLEALDDAPVDEHVAVFERAHAKLRGALDAEPAPDAGD